MKKRTCLVLFFGGNMELKLEFISTLIIHHFAFEYTGEYIRISMELECLRIELNQFGVGNLLEDATVCYEEINLPDDMSTRMFSKSEVNH